jgi:hypothetical protein
MPLISSGSDQDNSLVRDSLLIGHNTHPGLARWYATIFPHLYNMQHILVPVALGISNSTAKKKKKKKKKKKLKVI